jgi:hypothetical protein
MAAHDLFPVGSKVHHAGHINADGSRAVFVVESYWRGQPRLVLEGSYDTDPRYGITHVAPVSELEEAS